MSALIDLVALRATLAATPEPGTADEAPVSRRWLEQVERELTASRAVLSAATRQDRIEGAIGGMIQESAT